MPITPETNDVEIKTNGLLPAELKLSPSGIQKQHLKTDLIHALALMSGFDGAREHIVRVDATGAIKTNSSGTGFLHYDAISGTYDSSEPSAANVQFPNYMNLLDIIVNTNSINVQLMDSTSGAFGDTITLPVGHIELSFVTDSLKIWCSVSGSTSDVDMIGWYS